jgi:sec-independent protein translocase protein TatC
MTKASHRTPPLTSQTRAPAEPPTFLEHVIELRTRLFWVIAFLLVASSVGYGLQHQIIRVLVRPLGNHQLYYLTPIGGLAFIFKISFYFGIVLSVPIIVYHIYRYCEPLMPPHRKRSVLRYFIFSILLAASGVSFAYFVSLPAALHFLTGFNIDHITAMLTVDSYMSFVTMYLLGAAALFQIPLVLLIIDNITPLKPGGLMKYQRHVFLIAFILAAIVSPTPDMFNQTLLAVPIIFMYQVGVTLIWWKSRRRRRDQRQPAPTPQVREEKLPVRSVAMSISPKPARQPAPSVASVNPQVSPTTLRPTQPAPQLSEVRRSTTSSVSARSQPRRQEIRYRQPQRQLHLPSRNFSSIDGFIARS